MKKKKIAIIVASVICAVFVVAIVLGVYFFTKPKSMDDLIKDLDKKYTNLDDFELEAPFDTSRLNDYRLASISSSSHMGIDFFGNSGVSSIPFLSMVDGVVTNVEPWVMENQGGFDNWAYRIFITINSKYMILLNFETFGHTDEVKRQQEENLFVKKGDLIKKGDTIGNLIIGSEYAHVHYSLKLLNVLDTESWLVPEPFFSDTAVGLINTVFGYEAIMR